MRKLITILTFLLAPVLSFAQSDTGSIVGSLLIAFIVCAVALGIFLLIRSIMLWYWKVPELLQNQKQQIYEQQQTNYLLTVQNELLTKQLEIEGENNTLKS
jgi:hypothetical protein